MADDTRSVYCPQQASSPSSQTFLGSAKATVVMSSEDDDQLYDLTNAPELRCESTGTPDNTLADHITGHVSRSGTTLTLAMSSLRSVDDFIEVLAEPHLRPLPFYFFPALPTSATSMPRMHAALLPALNTHGLAATVAVLGALDNSATTLTGRLLNLFRFPTTITKVQVVGHGLGAATALLVGAAVRSETAHLAFPPTVEATLFGLPRVGDEAFANWIDSLTRDGKLKIHRVINGRDTVPHLPARHSGFVHPSFATEVWFTDDGAVQCTAGSGEYESERCAAAIALPRTGLRFHAGPYAGVDFDVC